MFLRIYSLHLKSIKIKILGRQFQYDRALEIIQEEEYLEDVDFNDIKRYYILKKIGEFKSDFNILKINQHRKWMPSHVQQTEHEDYKYNGKYSRNHYNFTQRQM